MRPRGVTNQMTRVVIPDTPVGTEEEFAKMMSDVRGSIEAAIDAIMALLAVDRDHGNDRRNILGRHAWMLPRCSRIWNRART